MKSSLTLRDIEAARDPVSRVSLHTPVLSSHALSVLCGAQVYLKAENLQRTGSFKVRGAAHFISCLSRGQRKRGVIAASAGNHSQGVALASRSAGVPCAVVMPKHASMPKVQATRGYGAEVVLHGESFDEAQAEAKRRAKETGLIFVPAFDDQAVIAGQGTVGLEILSDLADVEAVVVPVGGGGLISGVALAIKQVRPEVKVFGAQVNACPAAVLALRTGRRVAVRARPTIADGIAVGRVGELTFGLMQAYVDEIVAVSEEEVAHAVMLLLERAKLLVEGAGAVGVAALVGRHLSLDGRKVVALLSGGNVDAPLISRILEHGLAHAGRYLVLRVVVRDAPGQLARLLDVLAEAEANVTEVVHHRRGIHLAVGLVEVEVTTETRDQEHAAHLAVMLQARGYLVRPSTEPASSAAVLSFVAQDADLPE